MCYQVNYKMQNNNTNQYCLLDFKWQVLVKWQRSTDKRIHNLITIKTILQVYPEWSNNKILVNKTVEDFDSSPGILERSLRKNVGKYPYHHLEKILNVRIPNSIDKAIQSVLVAYNHKDCLRVHWATL